MNISRRDNRGRFLPTIIPSIPTTPTDTDTESSLTLSSLDLAGTRAPSPSCYSPQTLTPPPPTQAPTPLVDTAYLYMAEFTQPSVFSGDGGPDEDPQDFMNAFTRFVMMKGTFNDTQKVEFFGASLKSRSPAMIWFKGLAQADTASMTALKAAFALKWPEKAVVDKSSEEKANLLRAAIITERELGQQKKIGGINEYTHVIWADLVERLAGDIPDTANLLLSGIRKELPAPLRKAVGTKDKTWATFCDTVRNVSYEELMEKVKENLESVTTQARIEQLTNLQNNPSKILGRFPIPMQRQPTYTPRAPNQIPNTPNQFVERPIADRLRDVQALALPIQPDTPAGRAAYEAQLVVYSTTHGTKNPNELRPYPLSPGTCPAATGECWKCGGPAHHPRDCTRGKVPEREITWRRVAGTIANRARTAINTPNVNAIHVDSEGGCWIRQEEYEALFASMNLQSSQGKGEGSST